MATHLIDLTGQRFGKLIVLGRAVPPNVGSVSNWKTQCDCGKTRNATRPALVHRIKKDPKHVPSCGCASRDRHRERLIDLTGQRFGKLLVVGRHPKNRGNCPVWNAKCDCGKTCRVTRHELVYWTQRDPGYVPSCGCVVRSGVRYAFTPGDLLGKWTLLKVTGTPTTGSTRGTLWLARCSCGREESIVPTRKYFRKSCRVCSGNQYMHDGITDTIKGWAKRLGITRQALDVRLKKYPPEIALTAGRGHRLAPVAAVPEATVDVPVGPPENDLPYQILWAHGGVALGDGDRIKVGTCVGLRCVYEWNGEPCVESIWVHVKRIKKKSFVGVVEAPLSRVGSSPVKIGDTIRFGYGSIAAVRPKINRNTLLAWVLS